MTILVIAEHNNDVLKSATFNTVSAAIEIEAKVHVLVAGNKCQSVIKETASIRGVDRVLVAEGVQYWHHLAENLATLIVSLAGCYSHILAPATTFGKNVLPRVAALLDVGMISNVIDIVSKDEFRRPIYAGNAIAHVRSLDPIIIATVSATSFSKASSTDLPSDIESVEVCEESNMTTFVNNEIVESDRPDLTSARVVIAGGRGMGSKENFSLLGQLADKLDAAVGATRSAVDAGYVANDMQIGQTGKVVAPELYIAIGVSGAIQHLAGMKQSKTIVAVNIDDQAPIFEIADYGLVADLFDVIPELAQKL
ncbi:Electron transfer flavoprotein subunit alpha [Vibrio nigripulchritudo SFn27]|uniref:Electron transfer flavoprotein subunit alpha n=1 Tax=Vibrio nigripulchritudo TaxID=28173 RepID=U4JW48_9VIBR|nr:FAD-binding protein [Vibrio nigripulchritudo]CCN83822.1 Electron transfer flavoprotein subunit alpha [Vibrio nigripulchritudo BLFn1]CCN87170.1 Electron transfer flavoprotein subunit alpha [Vibrio nigripulchritudo SFn27]CCN94526.1 Electron transfer flavoprotein subunit alpha [Vibrio nigripulchritudo ENn2]CCO40908.1 Electron transfer flavoprotein subunit alpha [Vibrio nigripulchritudo SFn135]CCO54987.1 Electron transfer flavoprotein subunit alpha [Vibrio nigripulchritudo Wn13]